MRGRARRGMGFKRQFSGGYVVEGTFTSATTGAASIAPSELPQLRQNAREEKSEVLIFERCA
jgi:hypothetical protein